MDSQGIVVASLIFAREAARCQGSNAGSDDQGAARAEQHVTDCSNGLPVGLADGRAERAAMPLGMPPSSTRKRVASSAWENS